MVMDETTRKKGTGPHVAHIWSGSMRMMNPSNKVNAERYNPRTTLAGCSTTVIFQQGNYSRKREDDDEY